MKYDGKCECGKSGYTDSCGDTVCVECKAAEFTEECQGCGERGTTIGERSEINLYELRGGVYCPECFMATIHGFAVKGGRVSCDSCQAAQINGIYCHESGCPNAVHECAGCNTLIPVNAKYCPECL